MDKYPQTLILDCSHCGNRTPHSNAHAHSYPILFDEINDEEVHEPFFWASYICGTCHGLNLYGEFETYFNENWGAAKLYPRSSDLEPPSHTVTPPHPVPERITRIFKEVWPLRHRSPTAFVGQIRRLLEFICQDQKAAGNDLFNQLKDLVSKGVFPGYFSHITDLLRVVGNLGSHAAEEDLSVWDAELIEEFFRSIIDYVYIAPARIRKMQERIAAKKGA
jgi:hypothetical protein